MVVCVCGNGRWEWSLGAGGRPNLTGCDCTWFAAPGAHPQLPPLRRNQTKEIIYSRLLLEGDDEFDAAIKARRDALEKVGGSGGPGAPVCSWPVSLALSVF